MESKLKFLLRYAILAPSGHNSQPWKFKIGDNFIEMWANRESRRGEVDPDDREMFISLGCAIANLEIAANYFGMVFEKKYDNSKSNLVIVFKFIDGKKVGENQYLFKALTERKVNREEYDEKNIPKEIIKKIEKEYGEENGARLTLINQQKTKDKLGRLVEKSDRVWFKSKELVDEMEYWLQDDLNYSKDGLSTGVLNLYKLAVEVKYLISRDSKSVKERALRNRYLMEKAKIVAVVWTKSDSKKEWLAAGELYEKFALFLTRNNIQNAFFNTVIELKTQRKNLEKQLGIKGKAQLILRLGYSKKKAAHSPRKEVDAVLM